MNQVQGIYDLKQLNDLLTKFILDCADSLENVNNSISELSPQIDENDKNELSVNFINLRMTLKNCQITIDKLSDKV
jgi:hypothetical protein